MESTTPTPATSSSAAGLDSLAHAGLLSQWWFWAAVIVVLAATILIFYLLRRRRGTVAAAQGVLALDVAVISEQGARESQQDSCGVSAPELMPTHGFLAVLADGMGGLEDGDMVSRAAVGTMLDVFPCTDAYSEPELAMTEMLRRTNERINELLGPERLGECGSTLAAVLIRGERLYFASIGDSRIVLLHGGALYTLNREHDLKSELLRLAINGEGSAYEAFHSEERGALTSYLGMGRLRQVDMCSHPVRLYAGDTVAVMSDGVYNALDDEAIAAALSLPAGEAVRALADAISARALPRQDNYSAVVIKARTPQ